MVDQVKTFLDANWNQIAKKHNDFTEHKQVELKNVMSNCANDFEYPLQKPYDTENENFKYFALCLRNNVYLNPVLNSSKAVRRSVLGLDY